MVRKLNHRIHFVGIKGVAMTALAVWYKEAGYEVTGSDISEEFPTDEILDQANISVMDFQSKNITNIHPDLVIYTGAHGGRDNDEVVEALAQEIPTLPHGRALGKVMEGYKQISVAGSHGKTSTTAMIATILDFANFDPSWAVGCGQIRGLGLPGHFGKGDYFVAEADEYVTDPGHDMTPRFLWQTPEILVVTNIDYDHPDVYPSLAHVTAAFTILKKKAKIVIDSKDFRVTNVRFGNERTFFTLVQNDMTLGEFTLKIPGTHNAINAGAAIPAARQMGISTDVIREGLSRFGGTKRRFEFVGDYKGAKIFDDYAHHPKEISATIKAAKDWYPDSRIFIVFQPHTYSRTYALLSDFAHAFGGAHEVILTDIYASAREHDTMGITGKTLVQETSKYHTNVYWAPELHQVKNLLSQHIKPHDLIIFMGAGSIYTWAYSMI